MKKKILLRSSLTIVLLAQLNLANAAPKDCPGVGNVVVSAASLGTSYCVDGMMPVRAMIDRSELPTYCPIIAQTVSGPSHQCTAVQTILAGDEIQIEYEAKSKKYFFRVYAPSQSNLKVNGEMIPVRAPSSNEVVAHTANVNGVTYFVFLSDSPVGGDDVFKSIRVMAYNNNDSESACPRPVIDQITCPTWSASALQDSKAFRADGKIDPKELERRFNSKQGGVSQGGEPPPIPPR